MAGLGVDRTTTNAAARLAGTLPRARTMAPGTLVGTQLGQTIVAGGGIHSYSRPVSARPPRSG